MKTNHKRGFIARNDKAKCGRGTFTGHHARVAYGGKAVYFPRYLNEIDPFDNVSFEQIERELRAELDADYTAALKQEEDYCAFKAELASWADSELGESYTDEDSGFDEYWYVLPNVEPETYGPYAGNLFESEAVAEQRWNQRHTVNTFEE